jgi:hypothetical protein
MPRLRPTQPPPQAPVAVGAGGTGVAVGVGLLVAVGAAIVWVGVAGVAPPPPWPPWPPWVVNGATDGVTVLIAAVCVASAVTEAADRALSAAGVEGVAVLVMIGVPAGGGGGATMLSMPTSASRMSAPAPISAMVAHRPRGIGTLIRGGVASGIVSAAGWVSADSSRIARPFRRVAALYGTAVQPDHTQSLMRSVRDEQYAVKRDEPGMWHVSRSAYWWAITHDAYSTTQPGDTLI